MHIEHIARRLNFKCVEYTEPDQFGCVGQCSLFVDSLADNFQLQCQILEYETPNLHWFVTAIINGHEAISMRVHKSQTVESLITLILEDFHERHKLNQAGRT